MNPQLHWPYRPSFYLKEEKLKKVCIQTFCISSGLGLKYASSAEPHHSLGVRKAFEKSPEKKDESLKCPRHGCKIIDNCVHSVMNRATEILFRLYFFFYPDPPKDIIDDFIQTLKLFHFADKKRRELYEGFATRPPGVRDARIGF